MVRLRAAAQCEPSRAGLAMALLGRPVFSVAALTLRLRRAYVLYLGLAALATGGAATTFAATERVLSYAQVRGSS